MNFATDRDLLAFEPNLFRDVPFLSQQRLTAIDAAIAGNILTSASDFAVLGISVGDVVLVNDQPLEVLAREDANTLTVSQLRTSLIDAAIAPAPVAAGSLVVRTFAPQIALVHQSLLRMIGIDPDSNTEDDLGEDAILSLSLMARLESLGALERIYSAALTLTGDNDAVTAKAADYCKRFREAINRAAIRIDTDADGQADLERRPAIVTFTRT